LRAPDLNLSLRPTADVVADMIGGKERCGTIHKLLDAFLSHRYLTY
jgi:hypothetical protein